MSGLSSASAWSSAPTGNCWIETQTTASPTWIRGGRGYGPASLSQMKKMQKLDLSCCAKITDAGLQSLASLIDLKLLNLRWCYKITGAGLPSLASLTNLRQLDLSHFRY